MVDKRFIGVKELAEYLNIKPETVYAWVQQRKFPYVKIGRLVKFDPLKIDGWIKEHSIEQYNMY